jgi:regulator of sigma D
MRKTVLRRLEALEKEHRYREEQELSSLWTARMYIWRIVLAYYLGGLKSNEESASDANARALKYQSGYDYFEVILKVMHENDIKALSEISERYRDAYRRLFAKVGLDFDKTQPSVLFDAFVTMVNELPDKWLNRLRSDLQEWCSGVEIAAGSNLPRRLSADNFIE